MEHSGLCTRFLIEVWMKQLSGVFLEKKDLQHNGILERIAFFWYSLNLGLRERHVKLEVFSVSRAIFVDPGETRVTKKNWYPKIEKKNHLFASIINSLSWLKKFLLFRFLWKFESYFVIFWNVLRNADLLQFRRKKDSFREKWSPLIKQP